MKDPARLAVASRSFSKHPVLRAEVEALFERVTFNDEGRALSGDGLVAFLRGHEKAITALERVDDALLARLPELKVIGKVGVGLDMLDLEAMDRRGVRLGWEPGTNKRSVSELALGLILSLLRRIPEANAGLRGGAWSQPKGGCLTGRAVGLVGLGSVGKDLATLLAPFRCRLLCYDPRLDADFCSKNGVTPASLEDLLRESDVVTLHLPLLPATRGLLDGGRLALMKPGALLINTARGGLVDEGALKAALKAGRLAAAALDVFAEEPPKDSELLNLPNFLGTPHIAGSTEEAILAMGRAAIRGLADPRPARDFLAFR